MTDKAVPMVCLVCRDRGSYYGRLVFPDEMPAGDPWKATAECPNHAEGARPRLVPVPAGNTR